MDEVETGKTCSYNDHVEATLVAHDDGDDKTTPISSMLEIFSFEY